MNPTNVLDIPKIQINAQMSYEEISRQILDCQNKQLRNKTIPLVKVLWDQQWIEEATWKQESKMLAQYPWLFD